MTFKIARTKPVRLFAMLNDKDLFLLKLRLFFLALPVPCLSTNPHPKGQGRLYTGGLQGFLYCRTYN